MAIYSVVRGLKMVDHSFSPSKLNDAFGFATIVACVDAAKDVFAQPIIKISPLAAVFFVYFIAFRTKMYIDDSRHAFDQGGAFDVGIACLSWIAFIIAAGVLKKDVDLAIGWFCLGLILSIVWVLFSMGRAGFKNVHALYLGSNILHIILLVVALTTASVVPLLFAIAAVMLEAYVCEKRAEWLT